MYFDRTSPFSEILPNTNCEVDMAYNGQKKKKLRKGHLCLVCPIRMGKNNFL
jgi:hypothetical protein